MIVSDVWSELVDDLVDIVRELRAEPTREAYRMSCRATLGQQAVATPFRHTFTRSPAPARAFGGPRAG